ncbi:hypothetical protein [Fundidesulfovibrio terrae]|uniref:hypothetical protein n=1 Tax=Fundidesulfovibrio terrae TaxID=2922866 RepID=UPI001FAF1C5E|nr:hypothetical protein [Fundidesulfovibrio terrae]
MKRIILAALLVTAFATQASAYGSVSVGGPNVGFSVSVGTPPPPVYYAPPPPVYYGYSPGAYYVPAPPPPVYYYKPWKHHKHWRHWDD